MIKKNTQLKLFCFDLAKEMEQMYLNMNGIQRLFSAAVVFKWNYGTCARLNGVEYFISEFIPEIIFQSIPFHFSCIIVPHPHETCTLKIGFMYTLYRREYKNTHRLFTKRTNGDQINEIVSEIKQGYERYDHFSLVHINIHIVFQKCSRTQTYQLFFQGFANQFTNASVFRRDTTSFYGTNLILITFTKGESLESYW